jgi:hypothetical protein
LISNQCTKETRIKIADITIGVTSSDPELNIELEEEIVRFAMPEANPDLSVEAYWGTLNGKDKGQKVFDSGGAWQLYQKENSYWFHCTAPEFGDVPYKIARLDPDFSHGQIFLHRPFFETRKAVYPLQYPLDELFILNLLSQGRGAEVHACGIVDANGDGYLFVGQSGAGKTTMARSWEKESGTVILSDDRIILRQEDSQIWMYGTPWHGEAELASASKARLKQIYFIHYGRKNALKPKSAIEAAANLFSCSFPVFYSPSGLEFTLDFYGRVANAIPCNDLSVVPGREIISFIRKKQ